MVSKAVHIPNPSDDEPRGCSAAPHPEILPRRLLIPPPLESDALSGETAALIPLRRRRASRC